MGNILEVYSEMLIVGLFKSLSNLWTLYNTQRDITFYTGICPYIY